MDKIVEIISHFKKVSLADLDKVELMNRIDLKFCLHARLAPVIFESLITKYMALEIEGQSIFNYHNIYYDTVDNQMYLNHHNGKLNRFKVRVRKYNQTNISYLEIKYKNNKGRTIKNRIKRVSEGMIFNEKEAEFINYHCPYNSNELVPKIINTFKRITMVNNDFTERVTVDFVPGFKNKNNEITLNNMVIVEVKQDKASTSALFTRALRSFKIDNQGFSKYCIGRSLLDDIKSNNFKPLLLKIQKQYQN